MQIVAGVVLLLASGTVIGPENEWWNVFCFAEQEQRRS